MAKLSTKSYGDNKVHITTHMDGLVQIETGSVSVPFDPQHCKPHHWKIAEPQGAESEGVCKHCGGVKSFRNYTWEWDFITQAEHRMGRMTDNGGN